MKQLYFVTTNRGKVESANMILKNFGFSLIQIKDSIKEPEETNDSKIIVREKALTAIRKHQKPLVCEDGGFFVNILGGKPGAKVSNYLMEKGVKGLLKELEDKGDRSAYFLGVLAYIEPDWNEPIYFEEKLEGQITREERGSLKPFSWSELHLVFIPKGETKTLAEMSEDEYNRFRMGLNSRFVSLGEFLTSKEKVTV